MEPAVVIDGQPQKSKDKLCIIGCADSRKLAPFHATDEYEFWGVNNLFTSTETRPFTRWFEIHQILEKDGKWERRGQREFRGLKIERYLEYLAALDIPVYMQFKNPLVPKSVAFPWQQIVECLGNYLTNTISWQIALAICDGFEEIQIYGVDMAVDTEYHHQRPSCEYFLGVAAGRGIKIFLPDTSDLLKTRFLYGVHEHMELPFRNRINDMLVSMHAQREKAQKALLLEQKRLHEYTGCISAAREIDKIYKNVTGG